MIRVSLALVMILLIAGDVTAKDLSPSSDVKKPSATKERDVYYKVEGAISGPRAPHLSTVHYPTVLGESRVVVWIVAQHICIGLLLYWVRLFLWVF